MFIIQVNKKPHYLLINGVKIDDAKRVEIVKNKSFRLKIKKVTQSFTEKKKEFIFFILFVILFWLKFIGFFYQINVA